MFGKNDMKENPLPIYREYLKAGVDTEFTLNIKNNINGLTFNDFDGLSNLIKNYYDYLEKEIYSKFKDVNYRTSLNNELPNLSLGGGSGFFSKSLLYCFFVNIDVATEVIKHILEFKYSRQRHKHSIQDKIIAPRALKVAQYKGSNFIPGWCRIERI
jgi:hypothetical protein